MISFTINNEDGERREMKFSSFEEFSTWANEHFAEYTGFNSTNMGGGKDDERAEQTDP